MWTLSNAVASIAASTLRQTADIQDVTGVMEGLMASRQSNPAAIGAEDDRAERGL